MSILKSQKGDPAHLLGKVNGFTVYQVRRKPCAFKSCGKPGARFSPEFLIPSDDPPQCFTIGLQLNVCEECTRLPKRAFMSDVGWDYIVKLLDVNGILSHCRQPLNPETITLQFRDEKGEVVPWQSGLRER